MANNFLTPAMSLLVPVVGQELGPNWANDLNASLVIIDTHNHVPGSGSQVPPAGLNINSDLTFQANNATNLLTARFSPELVAIPAVLPNVGCIYVAGVDLYYNDLSGNQIQITKSGAVTGAAGTITGLPSGTASASFIAASGTFQFQQSTGVAANIDGGTLIVRYPGSYPTPAGNAILIEAPASLSTQYSLTLPALPSVTSVMVLTPAGIIATETDDQIGQGMTSVGANSIGVAMTSVGSNAISASRTRAVAQVVGIGGVAISPNSGTFTTSSGVFVPVSGLSCTITTSGRPIFIGLIPFIGSVGSNLNGDTMEIALFRNGIQQGSQLLNQSTAVSVPVSSFSQIDQVGAGTYTYTLQVSGGGNPCTVNMCQLCAYEL
jgi:hypothetical protein